MPGTQPRVEAVPETARTTRVPLLSRLLPRLLSAHYLHSRRRVLALLLAAATLMELFAGTGLAYLAGFYRVRTALGRFDGGWLAALAAVLVVSFAGYFYAYRGVFTVEGGPRLTPRQMAAVVAAGFSGFLGHGGGQVDQYVLEAAGAADSDARARVAGLAGLEQGVLAIGACGTAIAVLLSRSSVPSASFTVPWAVVPVPGLLIAFWAARRYRPRFAGSQSGWRRTVAAFLDSVCLLRVLFTHPRRWGSAVWGMALFWAADAFAVWAGLATFGFRMNAAALFVGYATGMVFTRRTGPLAGAGVLTLVLPLTIWASGAPFATAIAGVFVYRVLALWLPLPGSLVALPVLREMGDEDDPAAV
jgi:hypothetical protein